MGTIISLLLATLAVIVSAYLLPGVHVNSFLTALVVAIVLGAVNAILKPILVILTLPVTILTLGLFMFVINAFLVLLVSVFVPGFVVDGFLWALLFSLVMSVVGGVFSAISK